MNLANQLQVSYRDTPYHNQSHAADVVNYLMQLIFNHDILQICAMTMNDVLFTILSGAAHDMDHPGNNNLFEIKNQTKLAILYNDLSVLENHHAASFFFLIDNIQHDCNVLQDLKPQDRIEGRKQILENILGTDMARHSECQNELKAISGLESNDRALNGKNKLKIFKALVHAADLGNPTRDFKIAK